MEELKMSYDKKKTQKGPRQVNDWFKLNTGVK